MSSHGSLDTQQPNNQQVHSYPPREWILDIVSRLCQIPFNDSSRFFVPSLSILRISRQREYIVSKKLCTDRKRSYYCIDGQKHRQPLHPFTAMENMGRIAFCNNSFYFLKMFHLDLCHFSEIKLLLDINNGKNVSQRNTID